MNNIPSNLKAFLLCKLVAILSARRDAFIRWVGWIFVDIFGVSAYFLAELFRHSHFIGFHSFPSFTTHMWVYRLYGGVRLVPI